MAPKGGPTIYAAPSPKLQIVKRARYRGWLEVNTSQPDSTAAAGRQAVEEVLRRIPAADGAANVEIIPDTRAEQSSGSSERLAHTVIANSRVIGFVVSEFGDVAW